LSCRPHITGCRCAVLWMAVRRGRHDRPADSPLSAPVSGGGSSCSGPTSRYRAAGAGGRQSEAARTSSWPRAMWASWTDGPAPLVPWTRPFGKGSARSGGTTNVPAPEGEQRPCWYERPARRRLRQHRRHRAWRPGLRVCSRPRVIGVLLAVGVLAALGYVRWVSVSDAGARPRTRVGHLWVWILAHGVVGSREDMAWIALRF
jgi:hypothetical protein